MGRKTQVAPAGKRTILDALQIQMVLTKRPKDAYTVREMADHHHVSEKVIHRALREQPPGTVQTARVWDTDRRGHKFISQVYWMVDVGK